MTSAPTIETDSLVLRPHVLGDMDIFWDFYQSDRSAFMERPLGKSQLYSSFLAEVGSWEIYGYGGLAIETKDGQLMGQVCIAQPPHFPELELGWLLFDGFEGKGYAFEAASAMRDYGFEILGVQTLVSYIDRKNTRSIALAEKLGAVLDPKAKAYDDVDLVYRHMPQNDGNVEAYA